MREALPNYIVVVESAKSGCTWAETEKSLNVLGIWSGGGWRWRTMSDCTIFQLIITKIGSFVATARASIVRCYKLIISRDFGIVDMNLKTWPIET